MRFSRLLKKWVSVPVECDFDISHVFDDSRKVIPGSLFVMLSSSIDYLSQAIAHGAVGVIREGEGVQIVEGIPVVGLSSLKDKLYELYSVLFDHPRETFDLIGVTGTNGKSTTVHMISEFFSFESSAASIGTIAFRIGRESFPTSHTTPTLLSLFHFFDQCRTKKVKVVAMEVSSHALDQGRIEGLTFDYGIFTNLTRDHLDYHYTMEAYAAAKAKLFKKVTKASIINAQDPYASVMAEASSAPVHFFGTKDSDVYVTGVTSGLHETGMTVVSSKRRGFVTSPYLGQFNIDNLLPLFVLAPFYKIDFSNACAYVRKLSLPKGRLERFITGENHYFFVDYAHTPDALEKTLKVLKPLTKNRLICVFGCGGNRDKGKRSLMGGVAERYADLIILCDDNPRDEDPEYIIKDILLGISSHKNVFKLHDRKEAIRKAASLAKSGDVVLIAGKGHESTQIIKNQVLHCSDQETLASLYPDLLQ